jgi:hypothetical protein
MRFQLSIRDLLLTVAILALAAGWFIDHQRINRLTVQKWEYQVRHGSPNYHWLNELGEQGWEACSENGDHTIMKRPKQ